MRTLLIHNPAAGANRHDPRLPHLLQAHVRRHGSDAGIATTLRPGHATELAARAAAAGVACVVAVGGDGTANEVAAGLIGTDTALGLLPRGSGNGLARHLGVPLDPVSALALLDDPTATVLRMDTGTLAGHPFINVAGCGFDAELARRFQSSRRRGLLSYLALGLDTWRHFRPEHYEIQLGGTRFSRKAHLITFANSAQYGNGALIAPGARVDDGALDLVALSPTGMFAALRLSADLFRGRLDANPWVMRRSGAEFVVTRSSPGWIHTDGEPHWAPARLEVKVRPGSLRVLRPAGSPASAGTSRRFDRKGMTPMSPVHSSTANRG